MRILVMLTRGVVVGIDMMATYALQDWDEDFVRTLALDLLDMDPAPRGQFYK